MTTSDPVHLLDVNVLVALALDTHVHHRAAHAALARMPAWATCPMTESALMRILLNPAVTGAAFTATDVRGVLGGMRASSRWTFLPDDVSMAATTVDLEVMTGHRQVTEFHLVELAARHGAMLATFDRSLLAALAPPDRRHVAVLSLG